MLNVKVVSMSSNVRFSLVALLVLAAQLMAAKSDANQFTEVTDSDAGGHFFSQVIYAPPLKGLVSWETCVGEAGQPDTWDWEEIEIQGEHRPRRDEHMTIVYDTHRDRLVMLSSNEEQKPELWFLSLQDRRWIKNPKAAPGGVSTREAVYIPKQDAILAYGPARKDDQVWARVYLCAENKWIPLETETPQVTVHEVAL